MCLIVFAYRTHPEYRLIVAANRDEFYARPTATAGFWPDCPAVLAGRDMEQLGTWLGVTRTGRFAALTNYRDPKAIVPDALSRGGLVSDFLCGDLAPAEYLLQVQKTARRYSGFNLLVGDSESLWYYSNRTDEAAALSDGIHSLSNALLDSPWPKAEHAKACMASCLGSSGAVLEAGLFGLLGDDTRYADEQLPDTGVDLAMERLLSSIFIASPDYGTRSSTVLLIDNAGGVRFVERTLSDNRENAFAFTIRP